MTFTLLATLALIAGADTGRVTVRTAPAEPHIERRDGQALNFDLVIENGGTDTLHLMKIEVTVHDREGAIVSRRFLDSNGFSPSIHTIPDRTWLPGSARLVFNPFHSFPGHYDLARLTYDLTFRHGRSDSTVATTIHVRPAASTSDTDLILPIGGRLLVWDGHDFYSHHRRFDYTHPVAQQFGFTRNFMRYAYDFVRVDSAGSMRREGGADNGSYFGFGEAVIAPGNGVVVAAADGQPDNEKGKDFFDPMQLRANPMGLYGNHIVIDHGNGEFSLLGHLKLRSIAVKPGDRVQQGQKLAEVGSSGSSYFPHLHYELRSGSGSNVEGLPSYFRSFERLNGSQAQPGTDAIDTGDIVRSTAPVARP